MDKIKPVFIGACQRSGTTLLGTMLGNSPEAFTSPESQFKIALLTENRISKKCLNHRLLDNFRFKLWEINEKKINDFFQEDILGKILLEKILLEYRKSINSIGANVWIDHTPSNYMHFNKLSEIYTDAKFIFLIRDGRAVMNSLFNVHWGSNTAYEAAKLWLNSIALGLAAERKLGNRLKVVFYENLVSNTSYEIKSICSFLNISYDIKMLEGNNSFLPNYTRKQHASVGLKPKTEYINKWKGELSTKDIYIFEKKTGDMLTLLGYELLGKKVKLKKGDQIYSELYSLLKRLTTGKLNTKLRRMKI